MPKNLRAFIVIIFAWMGISMAISQAEPRDQSYRLMSVSQVMATGQDDQYVILIGHILGHREDSTYIFTDGTGMMKLEGGDSKLPPGQTLVIRGRVNRPFLGIGSMVVDVVHWRPLNGTTPSSSNL